MSAEAMRSLLAKYMRMVLDAEGITFLRDADKPDAMTDDEWALLIEISKEVVQ